MKIQPTNLLAALALTAMPPLAAGADDPDTRPRSRAPQPWRANQVQRRDAQRPLEVSDPAVIVDPQPVILAGAPNGDPVDGPAELEADIESLEENIAKRESAMAEKAFFERGDDTATEIREYDTWKESLASKLSKWEQTAAEIEEA